MAEQSYAAALKAGVPTQNRTGPPIAVVTLLTNTTSKVPLGTLHLYRDVNEVIKNDETQVIAPDTLDNLKMVCTASVPSFLSVPEFLNFVSPVDRFVSHYRVLGDTEPDKYNVVMKFRDANAAYDYYKQYHGRRYSSMEDDTCTVTFITDIQSVLEPPFTFPFNNNKNDDSVSCPVCLERMDDAVTGLLTILCQHTFHCYCLSKWGDGSCPVCRYSQKSASATSADPSATARQSQDSNQCLECGSTENLWVCLVCGYTGCGRDQKAHADHHYLNTNHLYALEIATQRVWDYAGDGYVHRLIQNMVDGKLVELPTAPGTTGEGSTHEDHVTSQEKVEAMSLEFTHLLTSQLESQRVYYEEQLEDTTAGLSALAGQVKEMAMTLHRLRANNEELTRTKEITSIELDAARRDKEKVDRGLQVLKTTLDAVRSRCSEEKKMTDELMQTNKNYMTELQAKTQMIEDLREQIRDLTFYLEAREKVQDNPELEGGSVGTQTTTHRKERRKKGKK